MESSAYPNPRAPLSHHVYMGRAEFVFLLLLFFVVVLGLLSRRLRTPYPIVMVIGGLILGTIPAIPDFTLDPDLVFLVILPPLLYSSAWITSWRDFRYNLLSISMLAFGLVGFTVFVVAWVAPAAFAGFDWRLGLVLGAVVAPTDAIAATSIARRVGLPGRIVDILEGESLINDASGLLALQFALQIVVHKRVPALWSGILTLAWLVAGGIVLGLLVGWIVYAIERRIEDGPIEIALSILVPYAVYLAAEQVHASGVLAVVTAGLFLSRRSAQFFSPRVRIQIWSVWEALTFVLNGLVFILIGLQLPTIRAAIRSYSLPELLIDGVIFSAMLILLRLAWTFPGAGLSSLVRTRLMHHKEKLPRAREVFVVGWTGMRGVVSLAAALSLPAVLADGAPFPHRDLIVFLTFCVIFVTLVLQGITLPPIIRALGLARASGPNCEEREARRLVLEAALAHLEQAKQHDTEAAAELYDHIAGHYRQRHADLSAADSRPEPTVEHRRYLDLSRETVRVERETAVRLRNEGRINDEVLRRLERELDLTESRWAMADE
jgi:CPA1 family monovalent cation:H+ antiporter